MPSFLQLILHFKLTTTPAKKCIFSKYNTPLRVTLFLKLYFSKGVNGFQNQTFWSYPHKKANRDLSDN